MRGARLGSTIGAIGGLLFVVLNAAPLPSPIDTIARVLAAVLFVAVLWLAVVRAPDAPAVERPPRAMRTYTVCVIGEVIAIPVGAALLTNVIDRPRLVLPWVVLVVGVHFIPFADAFAAPLFRRLGFALAAVAVVGAVVTAATGGDQPPAWTAVAAGFVLLGFSLQGRRARPS